MGEEGANQVEQSSRERATYSLMGVMKFDASAVAQALRSGTLSPFEVECLAQLLEGSASNGMRLVVTGQGRGWKPIFDKAKAYDRIIAVGRFVEAQLADGSSVEEAVLDAAASFDVSEPTIYRDLRLYRLMADEGE